MKVSEEVQRLLKEVVEHFDREDISVRERQIRTWKRLKLFWEGFQKTWYSEVAHDWRIDTDESDSSQSYYDKPVNVFRAYLESIIAALSVTVPPIKCFPDDADNTLDLSTARAGDKISQIIYRHNDVPLLWLHGSGFRRIPLLPGDDCGQASAINRHRHVTGYSSGRNGKRAFLWRQGSGVHNLGCYRRVTTAVASISMMRMRLPAHRLAPPATMQWCG